MSAPPLDLKIVDSVLDPEGSEHVARYRKLHEGGRFHYRVLVFLTGKDLPFVEKVSYELHPTFKRRVRTVERSPSNPRCKLMIWTWGLFRIHATVRTLDGRSVELEHDLEYDRAFNETSIEFIKS